jgi:serine/threonine protein kinase
MPVFAMDEGEVPAVPVPGFSSTATTMTTQTALEYSETSGIGTPRVARRDYAAVLSGSVNATSSPMRIASPSPARIPTPKNLKNEANDGRLDIEAVRKRAAKRKNKKKNNNGPGAPAVQTIRGFQTPVTSGGEESDISGANTPFLGPRRDFSSITSSPAMRPATPPSGISALKIKLEALKLDSKPSPPRSHQLCRVESGSGASEASDSERTETDTYEVQLETDFVSPDVESKRIPFPGIDTPPRHQSIARKMTADDFETLTCLGKGAFGTVLLVKQRETGRLFAQKQLKKASLVVRKKLIEQTRTERAILESVNRHPFVVKLFYAFQDNEKLYLILEYAQGGELFHHLSMERMFSEETAAFYMAEMVLALEHLHHNLGVVYRDLKPENCLLDSDGHLLLTDFGLSKVPVDADKCTSFLGTIEYMAPEVIAGQEYGRAVDWWSLGALGVDLLTGSPPFTGNNNAKIQQKIMHSKLQLPYYLGPDAKDLLTRFLRKEPNKRLGSHMPKDLQTIKSHRFFRKIDWKKLAKREMEPPIQPLITDPALAENFSTDFTDLSLSRATMRKSIVLDDGDSNMSGVDLSNPFGGFSFVASSSLLDCDDWRL